MCTLPSPLTGVMSTAVRSPVNAGVNVARHALWYLRYHSAQPKREQASAVGAVEAAPPHRRGRQLRAAPSRSRSRGASPLHPGTAGSPGPA